jgi:transcriptional regulator with XRE-family HTH domain
MAVTLDTGSAETLGRIVQFHRRQAGLTRVQLAERAGIGKTALFDLENGKQTVRLNTLLKILQALRITLSIDSALIQRFGVRPGVLCD